MTTITTLRAIFIDLLAETRRVYTDEPETPEYAAARASIVDTMLESTARDVAGLESDRDVLVASLAHAHLAIASTDPALAARLTADERVGAFVDNHARAIRDRALGAAWAEIVDTIKIANLTDDARDALKGAANRVLALAGYDVERHAAAFKWPGGVDALKAGKGAG